MKVIKPEDNKDYCDRNSHQPISLLSNKKIKINLSFKLLLILLLLGGGIVFKQIIKASQQPAAQTRTPKPLSQPQPVETTSLGKGEDTINIELLGHVKANENFTVRTQVDGVVEKILVREGDKVVPNQTIAFLDNSDQKIALSQATASLAYEQSRLADLEKGTRWETVAQKQAELTSAIAKEKKEKDNFQRIQILTRKGALSKRELIEAEADYDSAIADKLQKEATLLEAQAGPTKEEIDAQEGAVALAKAKLDKANLNLERTQIKSSVGGVISSRNISVGDYVENNIPIVTLIDADRVQIFLEIPENLTGKVKSGMTVQLTARALPQWSKKAEITEAIPIANNYSRRQLVRVNLKNYPLVLLPGMAINASLQLPTDSINSAKVNRFVVPRDALIKKNDRWIIFIVDNNIAREVEVKIVADIGTNFMINSSSKLKVGQSIVVRGGDGLENNELVHDVGKSK